MPKETVLLLAHVAVEVNDEQAIDRCFDGEWHRYFYKFDDKEEVLQHLAYNAVANGVEDASRLDGWADLPAGTLTMRVEMIEPA